MLRGIAFLALGLLALFWPSGSVSVLLRIFGFFLILDGVLHLLGVRRAKGRTATAVPSVISSALGAALLLLPKASIGLAFVLVGLWALVVGIGYLVTWWSMPASDPDRASSRTVGLLASLAGMVLILWPGTGSVALGWALALMALLASAIMFYLATRLKRMQDRLIR
ncbi:MAG: DUF308 domain-containing protein [Pseudomonadota bacterium]